MLVNVSTLTVWNGEPIDNVRYPLNIEQLWSAADLLAIGLAAPKRFVLPEGEVITGPLSFVKNADGSISQFYPTGPAPAPSSEQVDAERDRRIADLFVFSGKAYQLDPESQLNVTAMGTLAQAAVAGGAQAGNLRWADPNKDFGWIATDNSVVPMDAQTMFAMATAAMTWKSGCIFAAHTIKGLSPIPADYTADSRWPTPAA